MPVVTELVIDSAKAVSGAADYSRAMDSVSSAAQRGLGAISDAASKAKDSLSNLGAAATSVAPSITTMAIGVTAATAAFLAGFEAVKKMAAGLAEMGLSAKRANLDIEAFQQLQFAVGVGGVSAKDFSTGAEKLASNLSAATREENDMSKLLDANNIKWKDGNKLILDTNGLLNVARDLIHRAADEQQKIKMADMLGLTKEWVPALDMSAQAFGKLQTESSALGLVINKDIIAKAAEFDAEWRKSSLVFSTWMKAKLADLLPLLDELISKATEFSKGIMDSLDAANKSPAGQEFNLRSDRASAILEMLSVENDAKENADIVAAAAKAMAGTLSETTAKLIDQQIAAKGLVKYWNDYAASLNDAASVAEKFTKAQPAGANDNKIKNSVLPPKAEADETRDAWDRAVTTLDKHIGRLQADTLAVGQSTAAQAQLRAEFSLLEAAQVADKDVTDEQIAKYAQLRASMSATQALTSAGIKLDEDDVATIKKKSDATLAATAVLEKAKVASDISRGRQTALLSPEDVQIANQLRGIYPDIATALKSSEASAIRFNNALTQGKADAVEFTQSFVKGMMDGKSFMDALSSSLKNLSAKLADRAIVDLLSGDFEKAAIAGISAVATFIGSLFTGNSAQHLKDQIALIDKVSALQTRQIAATQDQSTLSGQLMAFDQQANIQRMMETRAGGAAMNELEKTLSEERMKIINDFNTQAAANDKAAADARLAAQEEINKRIQSAQDRVFNAQNDTSTLAGQLAAFDRQAQRDREDEIAKGGQALVDLEAAQAAERYNVIKSYNDKIVADATATAKQVLDAQTKVATQIVDYLNNLNVGPGSSLSPQDRLAAAQTTFNATSALAAGGNLDALNRFTTDAENLRKAAQDYYASGAGYQAILAVIKSTATALPVVSGSTDPLVNAMLGVKTAVQATTTAVTTDTTQTAQKLDVSIAKLDATVDTLKLIGQQDANVATGWYSRMVDQLVAISTYTKSMADYFSQFSRPSTVATAPHSDFSWWNPSTWFQQGGVVGAYAPGGIVGNGLFNVDSVRARYAGGGDIALAGGEGIINAQRTRQMGGAAAIAMLNHGMMPGAANDNSRGWGGADYTQHFMRIDSTNARGFSAVVQALREEIGDLRAEIARGNADKRQARNAPRLPGKAA